MPGGAKIYADRAEISAAWVSLIAAEDAAAQRTFALPLTWVEVV